MCFDISPNPDSEDTTGITGEIRRVKEEAEKEDRIFSEELPLKYSLLQKFSKEDMQRLCLELIGSNPPQQNYEDPASGTTRDLPLLKEDYIHFLVDEMRLDEIRDFALKHKIVDR